MTSEEVDVADNWDQVQGSRKCVELFGFSAADQNEIDQKVYEQLPNAISDHFDTFPNHTWLEPVISNLLLPAKEGGVGGKSKGKAKAKAKSKGKDPVPVAVRLDFVASARENRKCELLRALLGESGWRNVTHRGGAWQSLTANFEPSDFELPAVWPTPYVNRVTGRRVQIDQPVLEMVKAAAAQASPMATIASGAMDRLRAMRW